MLRRSLAAALVVAAIGGPAAADMPGLLRYWDANWSNFKVERPFMYKGGRKFGLFLTQRADLRLADDDTRVLWIKSRELLTEDFFQQLDAILGDKGLVIDQSLGFCDADARLLRFAPRLKYLDLEFLPRGGPLSGSGVGDDGVINGIAQLHDLQFLGVSAGRLHITDRGILDGIARLANLTCLDLGQSLSPLEPDRAGVIATGVTEHGIVDGILRMKRLQRLNLSHVALVSDRAIAALAGMQSLTHLRLEWFTTTDKTFLNGVSKLRNLTHLDCRFLGLTDRAVIEGIAPLPALTHLNMFHCGRATGLSDRACVEGISKVPRLVFLGLGRTLLGDGAAGGIAGLGGLKYLDLYGTKLSDRGIGNLRKALPRAVINRKPFDECEFNDWWSQ